MCGIVGYVGPRKSRPLLMAGLEKLEYRGYDSAGISVLDGDRVDAVRAVGNLTHLRGAIAQRKRINYLTFGEINGFETAVFDGANDQL